MTHVFDLNLRHLRALPYIVQRTSMSAAATDVGLSQPALTQGVAKLERQLVVELFTRRSNGMAATSAGAAVARRAGAAFDHLHAAFRGLARRGRSFSAPENLLTMTQLHCFLSFADAGSFTGASRAAGLSQPAIHRAVRDLEQLAGTTLVERRGRGVVLTAAGRQVGRGFRLAFAELQAAIEDAAPDIGTGQLAIGAMPLSRAHLVPGAVARLLGEASGARVDILEGSFRELARLLRDGNIDLMIGALREPEMPDLWQHALIRDRLIVTARKGHPLDRMPPATLAEMAAFPWIIPRLESPLRARWKQLFSSAGLLPPVAPVECGSVMAIRGILLGSDCLTLLSPDQISLELSSGLLSAISRPLASTERPIGVIARRDWRPTLLQQRFLALLTDTAETRPQDSE